MSMSAYSMTYRHTTDFELKVARLIGTLFDAAHALRAWWSEPMNREPRTADEVLALADRYETSQPGYAAELRGFVQIHQGRQD
ncbi:MAG: hypothetical protein RIQ60_3646 [Pseudomonadota bacterium]|jgi:hypothetical protein